MRKFMLALIFAGLAFAAPLSAGAAHAKSHHAKAKLSLKVSHGVVTLAKTANSALSSTGFSSHDSGFEISLQATVSAITPATATTPGSLTLTIGLQTLVVPLPTGTVLPSAVVVGANVVLKIELAQANRDNEGDDDDNVTTTTTTTPTPATTTTSAPTVVIAGNNQGGGDDGDHSGHGGSGRD